MTVYAEVESLRSTDLVFQTTACIKGKKVKLSLCLTKHHATKTYPHNEKFKETKKNTWSIGSFPFYYSKMRHLVADIPFRRTTHTAVYFETHGGNVSRRGLLGCASSISSVSSSLHHEDGSSMALWNVGILPQHYTASQPRRPRVEIIQTVF
jgi:hypothetical protein